MTKPRKGSRKVVMVDCPLGDVLLPTADYLNYRTTYKAAKAYRSWMWVHLTDGTQIIICTDKKKVPLRPGDVAILRCVSGAGVRSTYNGIWVREEEYKN